jgi:hypothetical protein
MVVPPEGLPSEGVAKVFVVVEAQVTENFDRFKQKEIHKEKEWLI